MCKHTKIINFGKSKIVCCLPVSGASLPPSILFFAPLRKTHDDSGAQRDKGGAQRDSVGA